MPRPPAILDPSLVTLPKRGFKGSKWKMDIPWDHVAELDLLRHACRQDFWTFFLYAFGAGLNPRFDRWVEPSVHMAIAHWFQKHVDEWFEARKDGVGIRKNLAAVIHRRVGKTTMLTRAGQLWLHLRDPELSSYTGSEKMELSGKMLAAMKAVLDGSDPHARFTQLYGNWATSARQWTGKEIVHAARKNTSRQDPSLGIFGVETSITGSHPDVLFYDDPISYERLKSDVNWLSAVNSQVASLFPALESDALVIWPGTRYSTEDHFGVAFAEEGVRSLEGTQTDSIEVSPDGKWDVFFMSGRDQDGKPTTPHVWSPREMDHYEKTNAEKFAAQVMNDPTQSEFNPITTEQLKQCMIPAKEVPWNALRIAILCDTAFAKAHSSRGKDWSVFIIEGYTRNGSGDVYILECHGDPQWRAEEFGNRLIAAVQRYRSKGLKIFKITDEVEVGGKPGSWKLALQGMFHDKNEAMPEFLQFDRHFGPKKISRFETAATFWVDGHVRVVETGPGVHLLVDQMKKIGEYKANPRLRNDFIDAHSDSFQPELYAPMRRSGPQRAPWERDSNLIEMQGLDYGMFDDSDEVRAWETLVPRPPLR
jgi:hypothetical protein